MMKNGIIAANNFSVVPGCNVSRMEKLSRNRIPYHLRAASQVENWILKNVLKLDPTTERIVKFYTYNDGKSAEFDFRCPNFTYDMISCMHDDLIEACHKIGYDLSESYGILGEYYYEVKVTIKYTPMGNTWRMTYDWEVLETDNPRCCLGSPYDRKDCSYLENIDSKLSIDGYELSGNYTSFVDVIKGITNKTIIVHSKSDAKSLLRIMKFLGIKVIMVDGVTKSNIPATRAVFDKNLFGYKLTVYNGVAVVRVIEKSEIVLTNPNELLDIDEFIVGKSVKAAMRDM